MSTTWTYKVLDLDPVCTSSVITAILELADGCIHSANIHWFSQCTQY